MADRTNRWAVAVCVVLPFIALIAIVYLVIEDWRAGAGEIGFHGLIALAGAGVFSLGLTVLLVWLMINSHRTGRDDQTGIPDDEKDRLRRQQDVDR